MSHCGSQARIDVPGQFYHVMSRGIERRSIFADEKDYADFQERMAVWLKKSGGKCLAWCLMPNHFHFLLFRGERPLSEVMHHVMTGYAINYNLRHTRAGHLFQNRYKAIICDLEEYLLELVPYIHLNPLRAKLVDNLAELKNYKWCGHAAVVTGIPDELMDRGALLSHFGEEERAALEKYERTMEEKYRETLAKDLSGGGLLRSAGGAGAVLRAFRAGDKVFSDQRVLGDVEFVESVLRRAGEALARERKSRGEVLEMVQKATGIAGSDIVRRTRERGPAQARAIYCYLCGRDAGVPGRELMAELGLSQSAVSRLAGRGRELLESGQIVIK